MFPQNEVIKQYSFSGKQRVVILGDCVWWFSGNNTDAKPHVARVVGLCEDNMVDLEVCSHTPSARLIFKSGVCLVGDTRLTSNVNYRDRGSWMPRWTESECLGQ